MPIEKSLIPSNSVQGNEIHKETKLKEISKKTFHLSPKKRQQRRNILIGIASLFILIIGVLTSTFVSKGSLDLRQRAATIPCTDENKNTVCGKNIECANKNELGVGTCAEKYCTTDTWITGTEPPLRQADCDNGLICVRFDKLTGRGKCEVGVPQVPNPGSQCISSSSKGSISLSCCNPSDYETRNNANTEKYCSPTIFCSGEGMSTRGVNFWGEETRTPCCSNQNLVEIGRNSDGTGFGFCRKTETISCTPEGASVSESKKSCCDNLAQDITGICGPCTTAGNNPASNRNRGCCVGTMANGPGGICVASISNNTTPTTPTTTAGPEVRKTCSDRGENINKKDGLGWCCKPYIEDKNGKCGECLKEGKKPSDYAEIKCCNDLVQNNPGNLGVCSPPTNGCANEKQIPFTNGHSDCCKGLASDPKNNLRCTPMIDMWKNVPCAESNERPYQINKNNQQKANCCSTLIYNSRADVCEKQISQSPANPPLPNQCSSNIDCGNGFSCQGGVCKQDGNLGQMCADGIRCSANEYCTNRQTGNCISKNNVPAGSNPAIANSTGGIVNNVTTCSGDTQCTGNQKCINGTCQDYSGGFRVSSCQRKCGMKCPDKSNSCEGSSFWKEGFSDDGRDKGSNCGAGPNVDAREACIINAENDCCAGEPFGNDRCGVNYTLIPERPIEGQPMSINYELVYSNGGYGGNKGAQLDNTKFGGVGGGKIDGSNPNGRWYSNANIPAPSAGTHTLKFGINDGRNQEGNPSPVEWCNAKTFTVLARSTATTTNAPSCTITANGQVASPNKVVNVTRGQAISLSARSNSVGSTRVGIRIAPISPANSWLASPNRPDGVGTVTHSWTPTTAGRYYVVCNDVVRNGAPAGGDQCSGNPWCEGNQCLPWKDCGNSDKIILNVQ